MLAFFKRFFSVKNYNKTSNDIEELENKKRKLENVLNNLLETEQKLKNIKNRNQEKTT